MITGPQPEDLPDYPAHVAAVRRWRVAPTLWARLGGFLWAETQREPWPTGEEYKFECKLGHDEPMLHCRCGIYACFDYETLDREWAVMVDGFSHVGGMIAVRGVFLEYEYGLRAQYATVVALFNDVPDGQLAIPKSEIAKAYDIEIISPDEFADFCDESGLVRLQADP